MGPRAARKDDDTDELPLTPLGEFMQRRNAELGLSVSAVAQRVGMSRATWYRIARGESASPGLHLLRGLARVYKVRAHELFALAASTEAPPPPPTALPSQRPSRAAEAGDALWRCRYDRQVRPGALLEVQLELLNLSHQPWLGAEVHALHDGWLPLGEGRAHAQSARGERSGLPSCIAALAATGPGEWARADLDLRAPLVAGPWVLCLVLHSGPKALPAGAGALVAIEVR